jgi:hypothetical protein
MCRRLSPTQCRSLLLPSSRAEPASPARWLTPTPLPSALEARCLPPASGVRSPPAAHTPSRPSTRATPTSSERGADMSRWRSPHRHRMLRPRPLSDHSGRPPRHRMSPGAHRSRGAVPRPSLVGGRGGHTGVRDRHCRVPPDRYRGSGSTPRPARQHHGTPGQPRRAQQPRSRG